MLICEQSGWVGAFEITVMDAVGTILHTEVVKNRLTNAALNAMRDVLSGDISDLQIRWLALGTSDAPIDDNDTTLGNEIFRTVFVDASKPTTGELKQLALVLNEEAVADIREIGIFAGPAATDNPNTGIMLSRIRWTRNKTSLESLQITRVDAIRRG